MRRSRSVRLLVVLALLAGMLVSSVPAASADVRTPIMQRDRLTDWQMADWYEDHRPAQWTFRVPNVTVRQLARIYIEEGRAEGVAGDIAFAQAVLETAYFYYPSNGQVRPHYNNFGGIGACDGGTCTVAQWPNARLGVRGQIHHLRAYADPHVTEGSLANPLQSPRFHLVNPKGSAPNWDDLGNGRWASDPAYSTKILNLYASMIQHARTNGGVRSGSFLDVSPGGVHYASIEAIAAAGITRGCTLFTYCPRRPTTRAQMASFLYHALDLPPASSNAFQDVGGTHRGAINALAAAGIVRGCTPTHYCPDDPITRGEMATLLTRALDLPQADGSQRFPDVDGRWTQSRMIGAVERAGITAGYPDGTFRPRDPITRAQMASFLHRAGLTS